MTAVVDSKCRVCAAACSGLFCGPHDYAWLRSSERGRFIDAPLDSPVRGTMLSDFVKRLQLEALNGQP